MWRGDYIPYFKINSPIFCWPFFFEEYFNPQVRINKMRNEDTVDYHISPSKLTSRIHPLISLCTPKSFFSPEYFLKFFSNLYIYTTNHGCWMASGILHHFCTFRQAKLSPRQKETTYFTRTTFSENLFFPIFTSIIKFHHLSSIYLFGFCFVVPQFRFTHAEVWRFFNLINSIFIKKYIVQE